MMQSGMPLLSYFFATMAGICLVSGIAVLAGGS